MNRRYRKRTTKTRCLAPAGLAPDGRSQPLAVHITVLREPQRHNRPYDPPREHCRP